MPWYKEKTNKQTNRQTNKTNLLTFISALLGGTSLASSILTSPSGIWLRHWWMMHILCLISSTRMRYLDGPQHTHLA